MSARGVPPASVDAASPGPSSLFTPANWLDAQARTDPSVRCLVDGVSGAVWTFGEVADRVNRLARQLQSLGVRLGSRVALLDVDSVDYVVTVMATLVAGGTYVPLNYRLTPSELANVVGRAEPAVIALGSRYVDHLPVLSAAAPGATSIGLDNSDTDRMSIDDLVHAQPDGAPLDLDHRWDDVVGLMFTSGTTGRPKGVMQSLGMVDRVTAAGVLDFRLRRDEFRYSASPMFHVAGLGCVYYGFARGFASLVLPQFDAERLVHWLGRGLTGFLAMPTMLDDLVRRSDLEPAAYRNLRSIAYGGAPIPLPLLERLVATFRCGFFNSFGAGTEAGGQTMLYPEDHDRAMQGDEHLLTSIGRPMYGVELRLCDDELRDVARGDVGEIVTRSNSVMSGYLDDPVATAASIVDGWFRAGDMATMDDAGYLYLTTRKTDMIIRGGENVYPSEIEAVLHRHPSVAHAAVVGLPDAHWGEVVVAAVEHKGAIDSNAPSAFVDELMSTCRASLASYKVPTRFLVVEHLPRNANGKVQKHLVADLFNQPDDQERGLP